MDLDKVYHNGIIHQKTLIDVFQKFIGQSSTGFGIILNDEIIYVNHRFLEIFRLKKVNLTRHSLKDILKLLPEDIANDLKGVIYQLQKKNKRNKLNNTHSSIISGNIDKSILEFKLRNIDHGEKKFIVISVHKIDQLIRSKIYNFNQKELETIIFTVSSRFSRNNNIGNAIHNSLRDICIVTDCCRAYIILFHKEKEFIKNIYEWCNEGIKTQSDSFKNFSDHNFPWWMRELREGRNIFIQDVKQLPKKASNEKKILEKQNVKSLLAYPIYLNSELSGFIGIDDTKGNKTWNELDFSVLRILSQIIGNALERESNEKKLKKSEAEYINIIENLNECYFEVDLKGNFTYFNPAVCKKLGYSKNELLGMNYHEILDEETERRILKVYNKIYETGNPKLNVEYPVKRKDGEYLFFRFSAYLRYDSHENKIGFYGLGRDITEKKKAERLKEKFHEELEQKVESRTKKLNEALEKQKRYQEEILKTSKFKSEFLATMSHELRTPLNAIIGFTDLLLEGAFGELNREQTEYLTDIKTSAEHQYEMISNILDITKIESGKVTLNKKYFSLNTVIEQVKSTIRPMYRKKDLYFKVEGLNSEAEIYADPIRFKEIMLNLLSNAIKFTESGKITLIIQEKFDKWIFKVRDTGIGIAREDFDLIFKEFKRVDSTYVRSTKGTGLGLSLTKRLVELHNGEISFVSVLGVGTTFKFYIPKNLDEPDII